MIDPVPRIERTSVAAFWFDVVVHPTDRPVPGPWHSSTAGRLGEWGSHVNQDKIAGGRPDLPRTTAGRWRSIDPQSAHLGQHSAGQRCPLMPYRQRRRQHSMPVHLNELVTDGDALWITTRHGTVPLGSQPIRASDRWRERFLHGEILHSGIDGSLQLPWHAHLC